MKSINFDLIYGLPGQNQQSMDNTISELLRFQPDRIAFYSYAHVPWIKPNQKHLEQFGLPSPREKIAMFLQARSRLIDAGYVEIGMDHFARPSDPLAEAYRNGKLHRNFMGYTVKEAPVLIGLGASAISDLDGVYAQNDSRWEDYVASVHSHHVSCQRGMLLSTTDQARRQIILDLMTRFEEDFSRIDSQFQLRLEQDFPEFEKMKSSLLADGLIEIHGQRVVVTSLGRYFVRNVAAAFDQYLGKNSPKTGAGPRFSQTV